MNPHITPDHIANAHDHARVARDLVLALGTGDKLGAARLLDGLSHRDAIGVAVQTAQIANALRRNLLGELTTEVFVDRIEQGVQK